MKFKILKSTPLFEQLLAVKDEIAEVQSKARVLLKEIGGISYFEAVGVLAGGISHVRFAQKKKDWVPSSEPGMYKPNPKNKEMLAKISNLPTVSYERLNSLLNFEPQTVNSLQTVVVVSYPDIFFRKDVILLDVENACEYEAPEGVIEILESEFFKLYRTEDKDTFVPINDQL